MTIGQNHASPVEAKAIEIARDRDAATIFRIEAADAMRREVLNVISVYEAKFKESFDLDSKNWVADETVKTLASIRSVIAQISTPSVIERF